MQAADAFQVTGINSDGEIVEVVGPKTVGQLEMVQNVVNTDVQQIEITCDTNTIYNVEIQQLAESAENLDPVPIEVAEPQLTLKDTIQMYVREALHNETSNEQETFEEADDFDMDDDSLPSSPYEFEEMQEEYLDTPLAEPEKATESPSEPPQEPKGNPPADDGSP